MAAQAAIEGRFLGGRPPYGYQLVDAGPHPNPAKAANGQRLRQLAPDPLAAPVVQRIFTEYVTGRGLHLIAASLNRDRIPSPAAHHPERNRHRAAGQGKWAKSAVRAILANPRYLGYEVWNKQRKDEEALLPGLDRWLAELFDDDDHIDATCERLAGVSEPDPATEERESALRAAIADCDRKLANYRALLDHEDAVTVAASWIADTQRERKQLERQLGHHVPGDQLTPEQVRPS